jgi:hypothetical protein
VGHAFVPKVEKALHNECVRRAAALAATAAAAASVACANGAEPRTGLYGSVARGPITPVCQVDEPCDEPARRITLTFVGEGTRVRVTTSEEGRYRVALAPGTYEIRVARRLGFLKERGVRVLRGRFTRRDILIDTGIR